MKGEEILEAINSQSAAGTAFQVNAKGFTGSQWDCDRFPLDMGGSLPRKGMKVCPYLRRLLNCCKPWPSGWEADPRGSLDHWNASIFSYFWHSIINVSNYVTLYQLWLCNKVPGYKSEDIPVSGIHHPQIEHTKSIRKFYKSKHHVCFLKWIKLKKRMWQKQPNAAVAKHTGL